MGDEGDLAAEMVARQVPVARLVGRTADGDLEARRLDQREGAHHLAPHAIDRAGRELSVMRRQPLAQHLRLTARPQRQAARRLGGGDVGDHLRAAPDQAVQLGVDGIDFLPQDFEIGSVHKGLCPLRSGDTTSARAA